MAVPGHPLRRSIVVGDDGAPSLGEALADPHVAEIVLPPGVYVEHVVIAPRAAPLVIRSSTGRADDVVVTFGLRQGDRDRTGMPFVQDCATVTVDADDVTLRDLTIENSFDKRRHADLPDVQAIALRTRGDRILVERCRLLGQQDTVLLDAPGWASVRRVHLRDCEIAGDVDFVYGRATALIEGGVIRSVGPGYVTAPSTALENPRGFLFHGVRLLADGLEAGTVKLGRPWHPGGKLDAVGQAIFSSCELGAHIAVDPWDDMGGFSWRDARFAEHGSIGQGAHGRGPRLDAAPDPASWLADAPARSGSPRVFVASDSTASAYPPERAPRSGWAEHLGAATGVEVRNRAVSGASARSFAEEGRLEAVLDEIGPGDLLLIGFGHNDPKPDARFSDVFTGFPAALRRYLVGARARGAVPVLVTPVERRAFVGGRAVATHGGYPEAVRALARAEGVALVDLTALSRRLWQDEGEEGSRASFLWLEPGAWPGFPDGEQDDTHLSSEGARRVAALVAAALRELALV
ncbi:pectinesterase family protein [Microbacterium sp. NPDC055683]